MPKKMRQRSTAIPRFQAPNWPRAISSSSMSWSFEAPKYEGNGTRPEEHWMLANALVVLARGDADNAALSSPAIFAGVECGSLTTGVNTYDDACITRSLIMTKAALALVRGGVRIMRDPHTGLGEANGFRKSHHS